MTDKIAKIIYQAMEWACANNTGDLAPKWTEGGNSHAQEEARSKATAILATQATDVQGFEEWLDEIKGPIPLAHTRRKAIEHLMHPLDEKFHQHFWHWLKSAFTAGAATIRVKDLVWEGIIAKLENGCYYQIIQSRTGKTWCLSFVYRGGSHTIGYRTTEVSAKAAGQAHHDQQVRSQIERA